MNKHLIVTAVLVTTLLGACAFGYQARGSLSDVAGELWGKGYPRDGKSGSFLLVDRSGRLSCEGLAYPPTGVANPGTCAGESGDGVIRCSDGRELPMRWEAISCRAWKGSGTDAQGNRLEFRIERR